MNWTGKIVSMLLGSFIAGPIGLLVGLCLGHLYDSGLLKRWLNLSPRNAASDRYKKQNQDIFFNTTFSVMGYIAKSDGRISEREIQVARSIMDQMGLNNLMKQEAIRLFNRGKQADFSLKVALSKLQKSCGRHPSLLQLFLNIQVQMGCADGEYLLPKKQHTLEYMFQRLGILRFNFEKFQKPFQQEEKDQRRSHQEQKTSYTAEQWHLSDAYKILGVSSTASNVEIKTTYRRLMNQYHPDKLISKDLRPEMIKLATQKTQQIKKAYDQIRKIRNIQ